MRRSKIDSKITFGKYRDLFPSAMSREKKISLLFSFCFKQKMRVSLSQCCARDLQDV